MNKISKNQDGFSAIELIIIIVILAVVGGVGYYVAKHMDDNKNKATQVVSSTTWKTYCDTTSKLCFKYPTTWSLTNQSDASLGIVQTLNNSSTTADIQYGNTLGSLGDPTSVFTSNPLSASAPAANISIDLSSTYNFYTTSISNPTNGSSNYKIVGGYYMSASENIPAYFIVNAATITSMSLKVGQVSQLTDSSFNLSDSLVPNNIILIAGGPITASPYTSSQAAAWLTSKDGEATLQILETFYSE